MNSYLRFVFIFVVLGEYCFAQDATSVFNSATANYNARQYKLAADGFAAFISSYPADARRVEATFRLAEAYRELQDYSHAGVCYKNVINEGLNNEYARQALFRVGEIPYLLGIYDQAKPLLIDYLTQLPQDPNLVFVLYYLGNIGLAQNSPAEAEYYFNLEIEFDNWLSTPPKGERRNESKLGLAMAKNRLGKFDEADSLYRELALDPSNPLVADAYGRWGLSQYDRHAFAEAASTLNAFLAKYPTSVLKTLAEETLAKCYIELNEYQRAIELVQRINPRTDSSRLLEVRLLFLTKRTDDGKRLLQQLDTTLGAKYRDKLEALKVNLAFDQNNYQEAIRIITTLGNVSYDSVNQRMNIGYYDNASLLGAEKLPQDSFLKLCQGLAVAYASTGDTARANATYAAMNLLARDGDPVLTEIVRRTSVALNSIIPNISVGGGSDATRFREAQERYNARDYASAITILTSLLQVNYSDYDNTMSIGYVPNTQSYNVSVSDNGKLSEDTFLNACQMLVLSNAYSGNGRRAEAAMAEMKRICDKIGSTWSQRLVSQTDSKLKRIPMSNGQQGASDSVASQDGNRDRIPNRGGSTSGSRGETMGSISGSQPPRQSDNSMRYDAQQQQTIAECQTLFKQKRYTEIDTKLNTLLLQNPSNVITAEAACLRAQALFALHRDKDAVVMGKLSLEKDPYGNFATDTLWITGMACIMSDETENAVPFFERLAKEFPQHKYIDGALYYLAVEDLENGDSQKANRRLLKIYHSYTKGTYWSHAAWQLAYSAYKRGDLEVADMYLRKLLSHPPNVVVVDRALFLKGQIAYEQKQWHVAQLAFAEVSRAVPDSPLSDWAVSAGKKAAGESKK
ncbi:MAG: outer membrane protein assembly factor BamD [Planctomycetaceae bacterium]|jgi:TolA-binding protein|nr:outer membrane protein assembly factor BamD [Planctomycetaceae bacterium]